MRVLFLLLVLLFGAGHCLGQSSRAKFEPPDGFIYHGVGQYPEGVDDYDVAMDDSTRPLVIKLYYDIPGSRGPKFAELRQMLAKEKGIGRIPELSLAFSDGPNATDSLIARSTQYDSVIDSLAKICREFGTRMFVRPGFEFNGSWNGYRPYTYVSAFRKVVDRFRVAGAADSVAFIWCYYSYGPNDFDSVDGRGARWYPGDDYVDWFGLDLFFSEDFDPLLPDFEGGRITTRGKTERFLEMARDRKKPVFLSEISAAGTNITADPIDGYDDWDAWFGPFFDFMDSHMEIKGFCYINWDWRNFNGLETWGNARIDSNAMLLDLYRAQMRLPWFIHLPAGSTPPTLAAPILVAPANNSTMLNTSLTLTWNGPALTEYYHLQVATTSDFASPFLHDSNSTAGSYLLTGLQGGITYYWRVRGENGETKSPWSETWNFTTAGSGGPVLPAQVILASPAPGATVTTPDLLFRWDASAPSIDRYWFEIATDASFTNSSIDSMLPGTSVTRQGLTDMTTYWWRVRAHNAAGWGPFSEARVLNVDFEASGISDRFDAVTGVRTLRVAPNPFTGMATISFTLTRRDHATLVVFDQLGREVRRLDAGELAAGEHTLRFDGGDLPAGVYLLRLSTAHESQRTTIHLVR